MRLRFEASFQGSKIHDFWTFVELLELNGGMSDLSVFSLVPFNHPPSSTKSIVQGADKEFSIDFLESIV